MDYEHGFPCGCSLENGFCNEHREMMGVIHEVWYSTKDNSLMLAIWSKSNGYEKKGYVPPQGYDWSGIRDSTPDAIEEMYEVVKNWMSVGRSIMRQDTIYPDQRQMWAEPINEIESELHISIQGARQTFCGRPVKRMTEVDYWEGNICKVCDDTERLSRYPTEPRSF